MSKLQPMLLTTLKGYSRQQFFKDVIAGIIVAVIALPLSIALAISSGVSPERGIITAIVAGFLISLLGGSRVQIGGPTGAFMIIVYGIVTKYGMDGLTLATIMGGIIIVLMGIFKLGSIIKFIPYPITTGFTSGIAVTIFTSQINDFFGLRAKGLPGDFIGKWQVYFKYFGSIDWIAVLMGMLALLIIILWPKVNRRIPGTLIAIVVTTLLTQVLKLNIETIGSHFGNLARTLPAPHIPSFDLDTIKLLIGPAFTVAILGSVESLLSAVVADGMINSKHRSNMELVAQGVANVASGVMGGIPATGAIARTVANIKNGGRTPISGMVHAITLLLVMLFLMPFAQMIPLTALAAVLIMVSYNMSGWREFKHLFKAPKSDIFVLLVTFFITIVIDLVTAIEIGMVLAALLFMKRMADVTIVSKPLDASEESDVTEDTKLVIPKDLLVYEINGPFFFGAADKFIETFKSIGEMKKYILIRMRNVPVMDATALYAFINFLEMCKKKNSTILISGLNEQPKAVLRKANIYEQVGEDHFFQTADLAIEYVFEKTKK